MGITHNEITLRNAGDVILALRGHIKKHEIRQMVVQAVVDTGAWTIVINEEIRVKLGLDIREVRFGTLANGYKDSYNLAGPLEVAWRDRWTACDALVLPSADEALLGAIPN